MYLKLFDGPQRNRTSLIVHVHILFHQYLIYLLYQSQTQIFLFHSSKSLVLSLLLSKYGEWNTRNPFLCKCISTFRERSNIKCLLRIRIIIVDHKNFFNPYKWPIDGIIKGVSLFILALNVWFLELLYTSYAWAPWCVYLLKNSVRIKHHHHHHHYHHHRHQYFSHPL